MKITILSIIPIFTHCYHCELWIFALFSCFRHPIMIVLKFIAIAIRIVLNFIIIIFRHLNRPRLMIGFTLDGKFIRRYDRDETGVAPSGANRGIRSGQILPDIEWDIKNSKGIPVAAGVYLIHVDAGELGERVIKWFGTNRQFDPSGL